MVIASETQNILVSLGLVGIKFGIKVGKIGRKQAANLDTGDVPVSRPS